MKYVFWSCIGVLILIQIAAYIVWRIAFHSPKKTQNDDFRLVNSEQARSLKETIYALIRNLNAIPYETVSVQSADGFRLNGRYYRQKEKRPLVICFHGYRGTPSRDFAGGANLYLEKGYSVLLVEQRAHLSSEGNAITLGIRERQDCLTWIQYAIERFGKDTEILLCGISMGATTVLLAAGMALPDNVKGIAADCAYLSPKAILESVLRNMKLPVHPVYWLLWLGAWLFSGINLSDRTADVRNALSGTNIPVLLIHGEADALVPCEMAKEIAKATPQSVRLHVFPKADHGMSCLIDPDRYRKIVTEFLESIFQDGKEAAETD